MKGFMGKAAQGYFIMSIATILIFLASFKATMYLGDLLSRSIF